MAKREILQVPIGAGRTHMREGRNTPVYRPDGMVGWILNFTPAGRGLINSGEDQFAVVRGDWLLFPPDVIHDYFADLDYGYWIHLWVYFTPRSHWLEYLDWEEESLGVLHLRQPKSKRRTQLQRRFEELINFVHSHRVHRIDLAMNALEEILLWLDNYNPRQGRKPMDERIRAIVDQLCSDYAKPFDLDALAAECGLSPSRFSHLFKSQVGSAPGQFLKQQRLQRAQELLLMTPMPITDVAATVGYDNPFYFTRIFHDHLGVSPREFRRREWL